MGRGRADTDLEDVEDAEEHAPRYLRFGVSTVPPESCGRAGIVLRHRIGGRDLLLPDRDAMGSLPVRIRPHRLAACSLPPDHVFGDEDRLLEPGAVRPAVGFGVVRDRHAHESCLVQSRTFRVPVAQRRLMGSTTGTASWPRRSGSRRMRCARRTRTARTSMEPDGARPLTSLSAGGGVNLPSGRRVTVAHRRAREPIRRIRHRPECESASRCTRPVRTRE